jgi:phosphoadenosine phosphosulfate reductase
MSTLLRFEGSAVPDLDRVAVELQGRSPEEVVEWTRDTFGEDVILSSSFGADSALMIHLVTRVIPRVRVVFIDTGYLFPETYRFAEELRERFALDLRVYSPLLSAARQEALYSKLWTGSEEDLARYQRINKIEPMDRALSELSPRAWIAGLRADQSPFRATLRPVELQNGVYKVHPVLGFRGEDVHHYLCQHDLPYHPLHSLGYRSIGDVHSTRISSKDEPARSGRSLGPHLECGLHLQRTLEEEASLRSSGL